MKKTIFTILLCGVMILGLTGCNNSEKKDDNDIHTFDGTIIECEKESMIVSPNENTEEHKSSDKFRIEYVNSFNSCNVGNKVKITYKGMINESYPAQIGTTNIEVVKDFDFYVTKPQVHNGIRFNDYYTSDNRTIYLAGNFEEFYVIDSGTKMTLKDYVSNANQTFERSIETITEKLELKDTLKDGGTNIYKSKDKDITMIVCNTTKNDKNILIGDYSMEYTDGDCKN